MKEYFVENQTDLESLCQHLRQQPVIALDTEFLREKTYYAKLCLIQVASAEQIACVDPLAIDDMQILLDVIYEPNITKVMHSARQDLEIFFDITGELPANMYDSQIAAALLGFGDQVGYASLLNDMLGVKLEKLHTRTDWSKRPLDEGQIQYALDDVRYLIDIYHMQKNKLMESGREHWLIDDFNYLSNKNLYTPNVAGSWQKVRGSNSLKGVQLAVLHNLAEWRETLAREKNRPKQWIIRDDMLVELSRRMPKNNDALEAMRGWDSGVGKHSAQILLNIEQAKNLDKEQWPQRPIRVSLNKTQEAIVDLLLAVVRLKAVENSVTPSALVNRRQLEKIVSGDHDCAVLKGWRNEIVGNEIMAVLENKRSLYVQEGQLRLEVKDPA